MRFLVAALAALAFSAGAAQTTFTHTQKGDNVGHIDYKGRKVAAVVTGVGVTQTSRDNAENAVARELTARGMQGVASHTILPNATLEPMTRERAAALLKQAGVAGVVVLKLVDTEKRTVPTEWASSDYRTSLASQNYFSPIGKEGDTYDRRITTFTIETMLFSLEPFTLLWSGQSQSVDPKKVDSFIREFARSVGDELRREGLVK